MPNPERPTLGNRRVKPEHAKSFAMYVREHEGWVAPALLMRAPDVFTFETNLSLGGVSFGIVGVPRSKRRDIRIIDGQHRILGLHIAVEDIARELDDARNRQAQATREADIDLANHYAPIIARLEKQRARLSSEHLAVQVHVETDQLHYEQMFFDVADNALGITQAVKVRFDSRKVMNRALDAAQRHALLRDRVDQEQDRISGPNPNLLGAKHVVDIVRTVNVGIVGRVSRRQEAELQEGALVQRSNEFFDVLLEAFDDLAAVADGTLSPEDLLEAEPARVLDDAARARWRLPRPGRRGLQRRGDPPFLPRDGPAPGRAYRRGEPVARDPNQGLRRRGCRPNRSCPRPPRSHRRDRGLD